MSNYDFTPMFRHSVGFEHIQQLMNATRSSSNDSFPPYNIESGSDDIYRITIAVAGYRETDLDVSLENGTLHILGHNSSSNDTSDFLYRGIASRSFHLKFNLADHIKVQNASLENGMLAIDLERKIPAALKPRNIEIKEGPIKTLPQKPENGFGRDHEAA